MNPTREQVIEWAAKAGITSDDAECQMPDLKAFAAIAYAAGVAKGINLAGEAHIAEHGYDKYGFAAAIQSLKGKQ